MKRFAFATLAALAAVVASQQQAKAWFNFSVGSSYNVNLSWGGHQGHCGHGSEPWPGNGQQCGPWGCGGYGMPGYGYGYGTGYGYGGQGGYIAPMPQGSGSSSGSPAGFNFIPVPMGYVY